MKNKLGAKKEQSIYVLYILNIYVYIIWAWTTLAADRRGRRKKALRTGLKNKWKLSGLRKMLPRTKNGTKNYCCEQKTHGGMVGWGKWLGNLWIAWNFLGGFFLSCSCSVIGWCELILISLIVLENLK